MNNNNDDEKDNFDQSTPEENTPKSPNTCSSKYLSPNKEERRVINMTFI
jgi:hypothetical protein